LRTITANSVPAVTRAKVEATLKAEAAKLDAQHRGTHIFNAIWQSDDPRCNWTTSFLCRGSNVPLDDMRDVLERVRRRFPEVKF
jgi:hypothetical protein